MDTMYVINTEAKMVILNVLAGADKSLVGLRVANSKVIEISEKNFTQLVLMVEGKLEYNVFRRNILAHWYNASLKCTPLIVLETIEQREVLSCYDSLIIDLFKLYKAEDIFSCYRLCYRYDEVTHRLRPGGILKGIKYEHAIDHLPRNYALTDDEKEKFPDWFAKYKGLIYTSKKPEFRRMIDLYFNSYLIGKPDASFILLFVVLEMYFGVDRENITEHIRKGVASLLGKNDKERKIIRNEIHNLYDVRSRFVHDGKAVDWNSLFSLRDYVRRVIVKLLEIEN